jgi:hypothetical protein
VFVVTSRASSATAIVAIEKQCPESRSVGTPMMAAMATLKAMPTGTSSGSPRLDYLVGTGGRGGNGKGAMCAEPT